MKKYLVKVCECGHIHLINKKDLCKAIKNDAEILLICGSCGTTSLIGAEADIEVNPNKTIHPSYTMYVMDNAINADSVDLAKTINLKSITQKDVCNIIYSKGIEVPMRTGGTARHYTGKNFMDTDYPQFFEDSLTEEMVCKFIKDWEVRRMKVDIYKLLDNLNEEQLEAITNAKVEGLHLDCPDVDDYDFTYSFDCDMNYI